MDIVTFEKERQLLKAQQMVLESIASELSRSKYLSVKESKDLLKECLKESNPK